MTEFEVNRLRNSSVAYISSTRGDIDMSPDYQRQGAIWSTEKQQLLIDSLINGFDVPKIYLHQFLAPRTLEDGRKVRYALIDGKQRLEAIFGFLDGDFALADDFQYLTDSQVQAQGRTYAELEKDQPALINLLNATNLDIMSIRTDDTELIEEMFSRLNEAAPLNAAEKRNAFGGPCPVAVRELSKLPFFEKKLPFGNSRYRHYDLAAKFLYWEDQERLSTPGERTVRDVKKYRLDTFFRSMKDAEQGAAWVAADQTAATQRLDTLAANFIDNDPLLTSIGMVSVYYLLAQKRASEGRFFPSRTTLLGFEDGRKLERMRDEDDLKQGDYQMLEFNRLAQSPNDGGALTFRLEIMEAYSSALERGSDPIQAVADLYRTAEE